ncbi:MAG: O-sialoglycoprotein endopeptidase [Peptococcaceae bacterium]|jgi:N6-L-threonylcarbamoyladenine synthase|nr:O-sialoglycoprotein endopeptidase [Peptococcaceae bacterium]
MAAKVFLGLDTSCYTTSLALTDGQGSPVFQQRLPLPVAAGEKGLRQSEAFYRHMAHLPDLFSALAAALPFSLSERLGAVAVSAQPCRRPDSYMPVFRAGLAAARMLAAATGAPLVETTHQEGHLMAALWSAGLSPEGPFLAYHLSGGTTELLLVKGFHRSSAPYFDCRLLAGALDIPAGQLIDRTGQILGLPFPAGPRLEKLARESDESREKGKKEEKDQKNENGAGTPAYRLPNYCREGNISFSGGEAWAKRALADGRAPAAIARTIELYIAGSLRKSVLACLSALGVEPAGATPGAERPRFLLFMGGVAANQYIQRQLSEGLMGIIPCYFAQPEYTGDNAMGVALIARGVSDRYTICHNQ